MSTRHRKKSLLKPLLIPAAAAVMTAYFGLHAWYGDQGVVGRTAVEARLVDLKIEHKIAVAEREAMERKVRLLRSEAVDRDMLDERARGLLGFAHANDVVVLRAAAR